MRAVGASPAMTAGDGLFGIMGAIILGALLAGLVAVALSPLAPLGPVRPFVPDGVAFDWTVLGLGAAVIVVILGTVAVLLAMQRAPHRATLWHSRPRLRPACAGAAASRGLPVSAVTGIRFALEPGAETDSVPVRSAILGATLAVVIVIATVVFGSSLNSLVSHPRLYGWNWDYAC